MDKEDVVHIYNGILFSHKKEWNKAICSNMDGPRACHTEWSELDREGEISCGMLHMWNLKRNDTNELNLQRRKRLTDLENELMVAGVGGRDSWGLWEDHVHTAIFKMGNQQGPTV